MSNLASAACIRPRGETVPPATSPERRLRNRWIARRAQNAEDAGRAEVPPGRSTGSKGKGIDWDIGGGGRTAAKGDICFPSPPFPFQSLTGGESSKK